MPHSQVTSTFNKPCYSWTFHCMFLFRPMYKTSKHFQCHYLIKYSQQNLLLCWQLQSVSLTIFMDNVTLQVTQGCTNSQNFIYFWYKFDWHNLWNNSEGISAYNPLNVDFHISNPPCAGGVFFRKLCPLLVKVGIVCFTFLSDSKSAMASVSHDLISWTQVLQKPWVACNEFVTTSVSINWGDEHY